MERTACKEAKKELRARVRAQVEALEPDYIQASNQAIAQNVLSLPEYRGASTVFCFVSAGREVETRPILLDALRSGKRVGVPLCTGKGIMEIREITSLGCLVPGKYFGILEPPAFSTVIEPDEVQFAVLPCASCDWQGRRLGFGGGYYDRYLERACFPSAVVCRERVMCAEIPTEEHDIPMRIIVTETGVHRLETR